MALSIGFLTPEYPHEKATHAAGIGTSVKNLAEALRDEGVTVSVFIYGQNIDELFFEEGIKVHLIKTRHFGFFTWIRYRKFIQNYLNYYIRKEYIDVIEAADWTGITAFMKLKAPLVIRFHGSDAYFCSLEKRKQKFKNFIFEKIAIMNGDAYVSPTHFAAKVTRSIFKLNKEVMTIPNGISIKKFNNDSPGSFQKGMILYVGTIIRKKGVLELPKIFDFVLKKNPDAELFLIGPDSPDYSTGAQSTWELLQSELHGETRNRVKYLGKVPYEQVTAYIKNANVCVFPTFAETMGMVTIESMAMSKAVVNSDIGWSQELIEDSVNGFLVHPKDHHKFAERIHEILSDKELCLKLGAAARLRAENTFDITKTVKDNISFYNSILQR